MKIGQEGDKRKFRSAKKDDYDVTKDMSKPVTKWTKCTVCGMEIKGKVWPGPSCFRCWNEGQG